MRVKILRPLSDTDKDTKQEYHLVEGDIVDVPHAYARRLINTDRARATATPPTSKLVTVGALAKLAATRKLKAAKAKTAKAKKDKPATRSWPIAEPKKLKSKKLKSGKKSPR